MDGYDEETIRQLELMNTRYEIEQRVRALSTAFNIGYMPQRREFERRVLEYVSPDVMTNDEWILVLQHHWIGSEPGHDLSMAN